MQFSKASTVHIKLIVTSGNSYNNYPWYLHTVTWSYNLGKKFKPIRIRHGKRYSEAFRKDGTNLEPSWCYSLTSQLSLMIPTSRDSWKKFLICWKTNWSLIHQWDSPTASSGMVLIPRQYKMLLWKFPLKISAVTNQVKTLWPQVMKWSINYRRRLCMLLLQAINLLINENDFLFQ